MFYSFGNVGDPSGNGLVLAEMIKQSSVLSELSYIMAESTVARIYFTGTSPIRKHKVDSLGF